MDELFTIEFCEDNHEKNQKWLLKVFGYNTLHLYFDTKEAAEKWYEENE